MKFEKLVSECIKRVNKIKKDEVLRGLGELLTESQKDWARAKLKDECLAYLKLLIM